MFRSTVIFCLTLLIPATVSAAPAYIDDRKFHLHVGIDELGNFNWGNFLYCLSTAKLPNDEEPRELDKKIPRLIITSIDNKTWVVSVKEDVSHVELESITIGTQKYYTLEDKRSLFLSIVGNCKLE